MSQTCTRVLNASVFNGLKILNGTILKNTPLPRLYHLSNHLAAKISFNLADIGEGIKEVVVKEWFVKEGDKVSQFDNICEVQSDKASVTITSRYDGVIVKLHHKIDETALVGKPLVDIETEDDEALESAPAQESQNATPEQPKQEPTPTKPTTVKEEISSPSAPSVKTEVIHDNSDILCIPSVRRLAKEHNIDLKRIEGTGRDGRITKDDVLNYMNRPKESPPPAVPEVLIPSSARTQIPTVADRTEPIKGFQKAMVKTMTDSLKIPHFVYSDELKFTNLTALRKTLKTTHNQSISSVPFLVKAVSNALLRYPVLNSSIDENCENVTYHGRHNIGLAMDTKIGLAVPVIKDCQSLSVLEIGEELRRLIKNGKDGVFAPNDLSGGTFAVSNIGSIGGTYMKPVILPPQVAIIAIGTSQVLPRYDENRNVIAEEIVNISVAADHRVIDGATVANFIKVLKKQIEYPYLLFLNI